MTYDVSLQTQMALDDCATGHYEPLVPFKK